MAELLPRGLILADTVNALCPARMSSSGVSGRGRCIIKVRKYICEDSVISRILSLDLSSELDPPAGGNWGTN